jgi:hypothetical protein
MEWGPVFPVYLGRILLRTQGWRPCRRQAVSDTTTWWSTFTHVLSEHQLAMFLLLLCSDLVVLYCELRCFYLVNMVLALASGIESERMWWTGTCAGTFLPRICKARFQQRLGT